MHLRAHAGILVEPAEARRDELRVVGCEVNRWLPQTLQKLFTQPSSSGRQSRTMSAPCVSLNDPGSVSAVMEGEVPARGWQRLQ